MYYLVTLKNGSVLNSKDYNKVKGSTEYEVGSLWKKEEGFVTIKTRRDTIYVIPKDSIDYIEII